MKLSKEIPYRNNMDLGVGFDDLTGETRDIIFEYSTIKPTNGLAGRGQSGRFIMKRVDTTEDLMSALNINVDIDGRFKLFGGGNEFDFVDKTKFNSQSTFLVARVDIQKAEKQFFEAKVKKTAIDLARTGNEKRFKELYGDFYVQGIIEGGEFYAVLEIIGFCREDEKIIANALEASYGILSLAGIDLNADVNIDTIKKMSKKEINIYINQRGGTGEDMIFQNDIGKLIESVKNFSLALQGNNGVNYRAHLKSYKTLDQLPETNYMLLQAKKDALDDCARKRIKYRTLLNDINFYDENATLYLPEPVISDEKLSLWKNQLTKLETLLRIHAIKVAGEIDFNDNFLEEIDGIPVNLSEMELPKRIEISTTQQRFEIPEFNGHPLDHAIAEIAWRKLPLSVSYVLNEVNGATSNIVTRTIPAGGEIVGAGEKLSIYYDGPKIVKEFITDTIPKNTGWQGRASSTRLRIK